MNFPAASTTANHDANASKLARFGHRHRVGLRANFSPITLRDWTPAIAHARSQPNAVSAQISERLSCGVAVEGVDIAGAAGMNTRQPTQLSPAQGGPNHAQLNNQQFSAAVSPVAETLGVQPIST